jgi:hypothetical protein
MSSMPVAVLLMKVNVHSAAFGKSSNIAVTFFNRVCICQLNKEHIQKKAKLLKSGNRIR